MRVRADKIMVFVACLMPVGGLAYGAFTGQLGVNPLEEITHQTGEWGLRLLMVTLAVTPLREWFGWNRLIQYRRMLGLFAFFYACLHLSMYLLFDHFFDFRAILEDILERPYITLGMTGFVLLVPLAITSTKGWIRRLGKNWQRLHRLAYPAAVAAVLHFIWLVKADFREPAIYAGLLCFLLGFRLLPARWRTRGRRRRIKVPGPGSAFVSPEIVRGPIL